MLGVPILFQIIVILFSIVLHELAHGLAAYHMGDSTPKYAGRLTLNPLKHLDVFGSFLLPLLLAVTTGGRFVFGYAKPVPYNPLNLNDQKYGPAKVALAGPMVNIALVVLFGALYRLLPSQLSYSLMPSLIAFVVWQNLVLAIFNLVPLQPLDGHWLLNTFLPYRFREIKYFLARYSTFLFIIFIFVFFKIFNPLID